ncbi:MAG: pyridoxine 5'-phosphate synthase [Bacteriovoracaceae bacterium]|jgi:pyridoxine 5-phosphate synthase|nr:pyridoxine 5'-phosphate synthase [Bacteriovoracaceae bacterium]
MVRLGVNVDHVATLRQARGEHYPSVADAAKESLFAGADQITIHLREDRRHIQDYDVPAVKQVTKEHNKLFNLEIGLDKQIVDIAIDIKPDWVCIVPEKREEKTTEGGLDLKNADTLLRLQEAMELIKKNAPKTKISLFVEADEAVLNHCIELKVDAVEIHTGEYAKVYLEDGDISLFIEKFKKAKTQIESAAIGFHAGHGLTDESLKPLCENKLFAEYNIGHWIISDSIFCGINKSIEKLLRVMGRI